MCSSFSGALSRLSSAPLDEQIESVHVLGGAGVYRVGSVPLSPLPPLPPLLSHSLYLFFSSSKNISSLTHTLFLFLSLPQEALDSPFCDRLYITKVEQDFECDVFWPGFNEDQYKLIG